MRIIGCDLHARQQTLAMLDTIKLLQVKQEENTLLTTADLVRDTALIVRVPRRFACLAYNRSRTHVGFAES
jgi:hypothetical protein